MTLLALCACNQVFGVKDTKQIDAAYFDAPTDAAFTCPPIGETPMLGATLHQDLLQFCNDYAIVGDRAIAACIVNNVSIVSEGLPDQMMSPAPGVPTSVGSDLYDLPRLSSDGQELYLRDYNLDTSTQQVLRFTRGADGMWQPGPAPAFALTPNDTFSTIVAGPTGDRLFVWNGTSGALNEWVHEAAGWRDAGSIATAGILPSQFISMNPADSKRALIYGVDHHTYYADRPDESAPFRPAVRLAEVPDYAFDATMTANCGRVYVSGLHSVFYVQQP